MNFILCYILARYSKNKSMIKVSFDFDATLTIPVSARLSSSLGECVEGND